MSSIKGRAERIATRGRTYEGRPCPHGHGTTRRSRDYRCVACHNAEGRNRRDRKAGGAISAERALREAYGPLKRNYNDAKRRAAKAGREFSLSLAEAAKLRDALTRPCPACQKDFSKDRPATLDRVLNHVGYTPDNTVVICLVCNMAKNTSDSARLAALAEWLRKEERARGYIV